MPDADLARGTPSSKFFRKKETQMNDMQQEAIVRMKALGIHSDVISAYKDRNEVMVSTEHGICNLSRCQKEAITHLKNSECKHEIYHCISNQTDVGEFLTALFVHKNKRKWKEQRRRLLIGYVRLGIWNERIDIWRSNLNWLIFEDGQVYRLT